MILEASTGYCSHHLTDGTNAGVKKGMKTKCQLVNFLSYISVFIVDWAIYSYLI